MNGPGQDMLWASDPRLHASLMASKDIESARTAILTLMAEREGALHARDCHFQALERSNALNCIRVMRNFLSPRNERVSGVSVVRHLFDLSPGSGEGVHPAFSKDILGP